MTFVKMLKSSQLEMTSAFYKIYEVVWCCDDFSYFMKCVEVVWYYDDFNSFMKGYMCLAPLESSSMSWSLKGNLLLELGTICQS